MSNAVASKGVSLANIFDPYVAGTTKARASDIDDAGNDTSNLYANIIYGSAAAATGIKSQNADLNTLYAAKGTASYSLPINGQTFTIAGSVVSGAVHATASFQINTSGWMVMVNSSSVSPTTKASGPMPTSATSIQITDTWENAPGDTNAGTVTNTCATATTIPSSGTVGCNVTESTGDTTGQTSHKLTIVMRNAGGGVVSTTTCYFICITSKG